MLPKHWCWYVVDPKEAVWYHRYRRIHDEYFLDRKRTKINLFRLLERLIKDIRIMAQKGKTNAKGKRATNTELRWISVNLNDEDQAECDAWLDANIPDCLGYLCNIAERGFSSSLKPGRDGDYMATIFGDVGTDDNRETIGVSAFASDPGDALAGVLYKFIVVLQWGSAVPARDDTSKRRFR